MERASNYKNDDLNLEATELRLGLPGTTNEQSSSSSSSTNPNSNKRSSSEMDSSLITSDHAPPPKAQVVGWPPVRSYRKNALQANALQEKLVQPTEITCGMFVKVSMDGAPYLRKIDLKCYKSYQELLKALENMFKCIDSFGVYSEREGYDGSDYVPTYEDKDGDLMLVGDVPWDMFIGSCKRLRVLKGFEAKGLGRSS